MAMRIFGRYSARYFWGLKKGYDARDLLQEMHDQPREFGVAESNRVNFQRAISEARDFNEWENSPFYLKDGKLDAKIYRLHDIEYSVYSPYDSLSHAFSLMDPPSGPVDPGFYAVKLAVITKLYHIMHPKLAPNRTCITFLENPKDSENHSHIITNDPILIPSIATGPISVVGSSIARGQGTFEIQKQNYLWMEKYGMLSWKKMEGEKRFETSEVNPSGKFRSGQRFGPCAETHAYPIMFMATEESLRQNINGIVMRTPQVGGSMSIDEIVEQPWRYCQDPCDNCKKAILGHYHADGTHFDVQNEKYWANLDWSKWLGK